MAGYTMGNADTRIRRTLGKKKIKLIPEIHNEFVYGKKSLYDENHNVIGISEENSDYCEGAINRGYSKETVEKIFDTMAAFAKYSFNKSHSFCYAVIAYKTAWLSCHYPVEFAIANCTVAETMEDVTATLSNARKRHIRILPPDINNSEIDFINDNGAIRFGLKAIKGLGESCMDFLSSYKKLSGYRFAGLDDFVSKITDSKDNIISSLLSNMRTSTGKNSPNPIKKNVIVALILSGCFDFENKNRYTLVNHYLMDIHGDKPGDKIKIAGKEYKLPLNDKKYGTKQILALEMAYLGTYISEHPLDKFPYVDFDNVSEGELIKIGGIITKIEKSETKWGKMYLTITFKAKDDIERRARIFDEAKCKSLLPDLKTNQIVVITGSYSVKFNSITVNDLKIQIDKKQLLEQHAPDIIETQHKTTAVAQGESNPFAKLFG